MNPTAMNSTPTRSLPLTTGAPVAPSLARATPDYAEFYPQLLALLKEYQSAGEMTRPFTEQGLGAQEERARRILAQTPENLAGASPGLQSSVRSASASALQPTISGAAAAGRILGARVNAAGGAVRSAERLFGANQRQVEKETAKKSRASSRVILPPHVKALTAALQASRFQGPEADGIYANPSLYLANYQSWKESGGDPAVFFKQFPPKTYINPANTWLPAEIMKFTKKQKTAGFQ